MGIFTRRNYYPSLIICEEKIQVIRLDDSGKKVSHLAEERLEPQIIKAGEVKDSKRLALSLRKLFQVANITERSVVVGIPENKCFTKVLDIPKLKMDELAEAVNWEADSYLPIESDQVYMDWKIIDASSKDNIRVLLIAVPKKIIKGYSVALKEANLIPVAYETTALSLVRLIEEEQIRALVIGVQRQHAILTLSKGKAIEASSIVSFSGVEDKGIEHLLQTINKMLSFYEAKRKDKEKVKSIYICGEGATEAIRNHIARGTNREVKFAPVSTNNIPQGKEQNFAIVASLAKKEIQAPKDEYTINLLPPLIQKEFDNLNNMKVKKLLLFLSTGVTTLTAVASLISLLVLKSIHSSLEQEKFNLSPLPPQTGKAVQETQRLNRAANTIIKIGASRIFPQKKIASILNSLPEGVKIILITINENQKKIRISGRATTRADLLKFKDSLEESQTFSEAILPLSSLQQSVNVDFVLSAKIN